MAKRRLFDSTDDLSLIGPAGQTVPHFSQLTDGEAPDGLI